MSKFVHLHNHTEYSLLDGAGRIKKLVARAKELDMPAVAITDHGVMYGVIDFYKEALKCGIKPIIGCEVYVAPRSRFDKVPKIDDSPYHLVLLAENQEGYQNLSRLVSLGFLEGFYYKPRVDKELLRKYHSGLIAFSACLGGEIPQAIIAGQLDKAYELAEEYRDIFGRGNFYLEIQQHGIEEQVKVNREIIKISRQLEIPLIATNDIHYVTKKEALAQDVLLCIQTGKTREEENRMKFPTDEFYLKSDEEMALLFGEYPEALANSLEIAERCQVEFEFDQLYLPQYQVPEGFTLDSYLRELCFAGADARYPSHTKEVAERLEYELQVIRQMDYSGYFLIVWDLVNYSREKGIMVGPGRGSAAGSIVAYCLGITNIDPLKYDLLFERFLNPERVSMPDIDIDFCFERRGEVIEYLIEKYGADRVSQIITFGTMAARGAIRDVGRVLNIPYADVDRVAKLIPGELGMTIEKALETSSELKHLVDADPQIAELIDLAQRLEGVPRHASTHAAGVVIARNPLMEHLPIQKTSDGTVTTQYAKETVEEIGLLKMDILGLRTLTVIRDALENIQRNSNMEINIDQIPLDDKNTYEMLSRGDSTGVFQLESSGMKNILRNLRPERFEDIIALVALYRPGPLGSGMVEDFINRKHGKIQTNYLHPDLEPILKETYGVILYQEQVMKIAGVMAGFSMGEADMLRRAMGKKKPEVIAGQRKNFLSGAVKHQVDEGVAGQIFDLMEYFAGYGFNKSHSAAYALVSYQTAFLKANYPVEYMAALLTSIMDNADRVPLYIDECKNMQIEILPPDINESLIDFTVVEHKIRFGLAAVKNVGRSAIENIILARKESGRFISLEDFCERVSINKRVLESLIRCGAFDSLGFKRSQLLAVMDTCVDLGQKVNQEKASGQISLFDVGWEGNGRGQSFIEMPQIPEFSQKELLAMEKEMIGFYISGHPLLPYAPILSNEAVLSIDLLAQKSEGDKVKMGGVVSSFRQMITKKGAQMAQFTLEDFSGSVRCLMFPQGYQRYGEYLGLDRVVIAEGRVNMQEDEQKIFCDFVKEINLEDKSETPRKEKLYLGLSENKEMFLGKVIETLEIYPGDVPVLLKIIKTGKIRKLDEKHWVNLSERLISSLENILGKENVFLKTGG